jgi:hypothetical protein
MRFPLVTASYACYDPEVREVSIQLRGALEGSTWTTGKRASSSVIPPEAGIQVIQSRSRLLPLMTERLLRETDCSCASMIPFISCE